jgi:hypothetical protein
MNAATAQVRKAQLFNLLTVHDLVTMFETTSQMNSEEIPTVRGWIMDELEARDAAAFDKWLNTIPTVDSPRTFFAHLK